MDNIYGYRVRESAARARMPGLTIHREERTPIQREIVAVVNEEKATSDPALRRRLFVRLDDLITRFNESFGDGHSNPEWITRVMTAICLFTKGRITDAEQLERESVRYARTPREKAISLSNLAESLLRDERQRTDALEPALRAVELDPRNSGHWFQALRAGLLNGRPDIAGAILEELPEVFDLTDRSSGFSLYLIGYFNELQQFRSVCPQLDQLYARLKLDGEHEYETKTG